MKKLLILVLALNLSGCVTAIPTSNEESCSREGMVLEGVAIGSESSSAVAYNGKSFVNIVGDSYSRNVSCRIPKTPEESCRINALRAGLNEKDLFNESVGTYRFLTGAGYFIYIVPGLVLHYSFNSDRSTYSIRAKEKTNEALVQCLPENFPPQIRTPAQD